jgi:hypothetical protein
MPTIAHKKKPIIAQIRVGIRGVVDDL